MIAFPESRLNARLRRMIDDLRKCCYRFSSQCDIIPDMLEREMKRIAVLAPSGATSNWRKLEGIMEFAHTRPDWEVQVVTSERLAEIRRTIRTFKPDGIICALLDEKTKAYVASLDIPVVIAFHQDEPIIHTNSRLHYVTSDSVKIGRKIARHVYANGYRSFLCVGKRGSPWERERFDAFERDVAKFNCKTNRLPMPISSSDLLKALEKLPQRSAVFAADDNVAISVLNLARKSGIAVPQRFGVIGVSNLEIQCNNSHPTLTSLEQNFAHGGYLAAQRLKTLMDGGIVPDVSYYPPGNICERNSLPALHAQHSLAVDLATAFIERNLRRPIEVPDVVSAAGVSRRTLENMFKRELSASIAGTIRKMRLDHLAAQLSATETPISGICLDCGWPHAAHAMRLFKARFGMTMRDYRNQKRHA